MKQLKILAIHKSPEHNCYVFPKQQSFFRFARRLLEELGFENCEYESFGRAWDKKRGEYSQKKEISIEKYCDWRQTFQHQDYFIEFIFGKDKVFLLMHTKKDMQQEFSNLIFKSLNSR